MAQSEVTPDEIMETVRRCWALITLLASGDEAAESEGEQIIEWLISTADQACLTVSTLAGLVTMLADVVAQGEHRSLRSFIQELAAGMEQSAVDLPELDAAAGVEAVKAAWTRGEGD